jgi:hypothetical protein
LDLIRNNNLAIGLSDKKTEKIGDKLIVWLSFNVHGNEFAGTEMTAYELVNAANSVSRKELESTIVILDLALILTDILDMEIGSEKFQEKTHPELSDREHMEVWPGGRYNHYIFDLNRDWAWQTQLESQQRLALYNEWLPQMHVDVHEMGYNSPYFFPPSAEPLNILRNTRRFSQHLGAKLLASLMLKIGCTTPENDLICFILVMGIPTQPITEQLE